MIYRINNPFPFSQEDKSDQIVELHSKCETDKNMNRTRHLLALLTYPGSFTPELPSKIVNKLYANHVVFIIRQIQYWINRLENEEDYHKICESLKKCIDLCVDNFLKTRKIFSVSTNNIKIFKPYYKHILQNLHKNWSMVSSKFTLQKNWSMVSSALDKCVSHESWAFSYKINIWTNGWTR